MLTLVHTVSKMVTYLENLTKSANFKVLMEKLEKMEKSWECVLPEMFCLV